MAELKPSRQGQPWTDEEALQLLKEIQKKETIERIAEIHQRSFGGIKSRLKLLAWEYHHYEQKPIEHIMKLTGLSKDEINFTINSRQKYLDRKNPILSIQKTPTQTPAEKMIILLTEIRDKMNEMCEILKTRP